MSEDDRATSETPRMRGGLLGLLGRLFGRRQPSAPTPSPASTAADAPVGEQPLPGRPAAWEGPLARGEQPVSPATSEPASGAALELTVTAAPAQPDAATLPQPSETAVPQPAGDAPGWSRPASASPVEAMLPAEAVSAATASEAAGAETTDAETAPAVAAFEPTATEPERAAAEPSASAGAVGERSDLRPLVAVQNAEPEQRAAPPEATSGAETAALPEPAPASPLPGSHNVVPATSHASSPDAATLATPPAAEAQPEAPSRSAAPASPPLAQTATPGPAAQRPLLNPVERARAALEEARRQMPGLLADAADALPAASATAELAREKPFAAEWPGMLEGLRQAREGLAGEVDQLRAVVGELRREVGRLSDVVTHLQRPGEAAKPATAAAAGGAIPRLEAIMEQLRAISGRSASLGARPFAAGSGAPLVPPAILQNAPPFGARPLPSIFWPGTTPSEQHAAMQGSATVAPAGASEPSGEAAASPRAAATLLTVAPVDGLRALSALERRVAATDGVQRLELAGYRRGEATFRVTLATGTTIQDAIKSVPDATTEIADVRVEDRAAHVRLSPRAEAALSPS